MTRDAVIAEAMTWLKTPYHSHARIKGVGVDCAQFPAAVYGYCGLVPELNPTYDAQWYQHHDEEKYLEWVRPYAREIDPKDVQAGDFLVWRFGRTFSHGGIVVDDCRVIHSQKPVGVIITNFIQSTELNTKPVKAFSVFAINCTENKGDVHGG